MKTAAEKVFNFMHRNHSVAIYPLSLTQQEELSASLILLLKEQDQDTRHACAEAVISLNGYMDGPPSGCSKIILADEAHSACMNAIAL